MCRREWRSMCECEGEGWTSNAEFVIAGGISFGLGLCRVLCA